jgi:flavin-dependent dehydrogenase
MIRWTVLSNNAEIPARCDIAVIGGGPAGASAAALLARKGVSVVVFEKAQHPRPQVGESLIPHFWKYADLLGISPLLEQQGFIAKAGGITVWNGEIRRIAFADFGFSRPALHVERDQFDALLLRHAEVLGAMVFQQVAAVSVKLDCDWPLLEYEDRRAGEACVGQLACRLVIDASGAQSLLARQFQSRRLIDSKMRFLSLWGYFRDSRFVAADGCSHPASALSKMKPVTFVTSFADGWIWHIPLRETTSVGLVINTQLARSLDKAEREHFFLNALRSAPYLRELLADAQYENGSLCERPDYSYYSSQVCGENFYCIGDAASFVDPIFSHGVLNAFYNATIAAAAAVESLAHPSRRGRCAQLCENRIRQFYGFSRSLALGEFGGDGVDPVLVRSLMRQMPKVELDLMLAAASMTDRSENFYHLARAAGIDFHAERLGAHRMEALTL